MNKAPTNTQIRLSKKIAFLSWNIVNRKICHMQKISSALKLLRKLLLWVHLNFFIIICYRYLLYVHIDLAQNFCRLGKEVYVSKASI